MQVQEWLRQGFLVMDRETAEIITDAIAFMDERFVPVPSPATEAEAELLCNDVHYARAYLQKWCS